MVQTQTLDLLQTRACGPWNTSALPCVCHFGRAALPASAWAEEDYKPGLDALPFSVRATTPATWTDLGDGLKVRSHDAAWLTSTGVPNVGVRMSGAYDNRATIVAPSSRVLDALTSGVDGDARVVVYT